MKTRHFITFAAVALLLGACIPSVNPFYTEKDVVFEKALVGEWKAKDESSEPNSWKFEATDDKSYKLTVTEKGVKHGEFHAHLFKLKGNYFLDLIPSHCDYDTNQADLVAFAMSPGHLLAYVPQIEPELKLAFFNFNWLEDYLNKHPKALEHRADDKSTTVLTADTVDLQKFIVKHLATNELFKVPGELIRATPDAAPQK